MRDLLSISRFALLTDLSPRLLRKLDERGVLKPAWVDPGTHYRYYRYDQLREGNLIRVARQFRLPTAELRALLGRREPQALRAALERHRERLRQQVDDLARLLALLDHELARSDVPFSYDCRLRDDPARTVACARGSAPRLHPHDPMSLEARIEEVADRVYAGLAAAGIAPAGPAFVVYHDRPDQTDRITFEVCVPVPPGAVGDEAAGTDRDRAAGAGADAGPAGFRVLPPTTLAVTVHTGPYETIWNAYSALGLWAAERGLEVCGPVRETGLVSPLDTPDPTRWVTEIALPVRRRASDGRDASPEDAPAGTATAAP